MDKNVAAATALPTDSKAGAATSALSYDDFEPFCSWKREEGQETLVVHVPEFKREQMKVHICNNRVLKVTGERPLDNTKRSHFTKEIKIPKDCNANDITAKFTNAGLLYIGMPKKIASVQQPQDKPNVAVIGGGLKAAMVVVLVVAIAVGGYATYKYRFSDSDVGASVSYGSNM